MDYATIFYNGKKIFSGHPPGHNGTISRMVKDIKNNGWCMLPIPVVDMGAYFQAVDGTHRIAAGSQAKCCPEIVVVDARLHPDQPIPKEWKEIVNAPLAFGKTIRGYGLKPDIRKEHIGVVLDSDREILNLKYVKLLFDLLLHLGRNVPIIKDENNG